MALVMRAWSLLAGCLLSSVIAADSLPVSFWEAQLSIAGNTVPSVGVDLVGQRVSFFLALLNSTQSVSTYELVVSDVHVITSTNGGPWIDAPSASSMAAFSKPFYFTVGKTGLVEATSYAPNEDEQVLLTKKGLVSSLQLTMPDSSNKDSDVSVSLGRYLAAGLRRVNSDGDGGEGNRRGRGHASAAAAAFADLPATFAADEVDSSGFYKAIYTVEQPPSGRVLRDSDGTEVVRVTKHRTQDSYYVKSDAGERGSAASSQGVVG